MGTAGSRMYMCRNLLPTEKGESEHTTSVVLGKEMEPPLQNVSFLTKLRWAKHRGNAVVLFAEYYSLSKTERNVYLHYSLTVAETQN